MCRQYGTALACHLPPDAMHFVLQVLLLGSVASGTMAVLRQRL
jgi:hypothetical protein